MKLLLDENIPFNLYKDFPPQHPAFSVNYMNSCSAQESNDYAVLSPIVPKILRAIESGVKPGPYLITEKS